jgi:hypothetical protein
MAWRMHKKIGKAAVKSMLANKLADPYLVTQTVADPENPEEVTQVKRPDFKRDRDNLSSGEKWQARKAEKKYNKYMRQVNRHVHGRKIPLTSKKIKGFEQLVQGGKDRSDRNS